MKTNMLKITALLVIIVSCMLACNDPKPEPKGDENPKDSVICEFENPLTDLLWLKDKVDEITLQFQDNPLHIAIYQCTYGDEETGFLIDKGNIKSFYNSEGEILCAMGGITGATCPELKINLENKKLIWEINN